MVTLTLSVVPCIFLSACVCCTLSIICCNSASVRLFCIILFFCALVSSLFGHCPTIPASCAFLSMSGVIIEGRLSLCSFMYVVIAFLPFPNLICCSNASIFPCSVACSLICSKILKPICRSSTPCHLKSCLSLCISGFVLVLMILLSSVMASGSEISPLARFVATLSISSMPV